MASAHDLTELEKDPRLFLFTSLTAGSSHIITATSRMETILKANKIPFQALDTATDEKARRLWQRRAGKRKLPGLVKDGFVIGDLTEVEEWNEFGELKENIGPVPASNAPPAGGRVGVQTAPPLSHNTSPVSTSNKPVPVNKVPQPVFDKSKAIALPGAAEIAARNKAKTPTSVEAINVETHTSSPEEKKSTAAKDIKSDHPALEHLSAPASRIQSGTVTPAQVEASATVEEKQKHRGSEIVAADAEEVKKIEKSNSLQEEPNEDEDEADEAVEKGVSRLRVDDDKKPTQEQDAKEAEDAGKTVAD